MTRRRLGSCACVVGAVMTSALVAAGCAFGFGGGSAPAILPDDYMKSDAHMARARFRVMPDPKDPSQPAAFNRIRRVYVTGSGPKVILLHELPGLRDGDIELGAELGSRFEVYMPLLFGVAGQDDTGLGTRQACKTGLFQCNDRNTRHSITTDLLSMTNHICGGAECGVIGMCLTGSFPLYLMPAEGVVALVMAQPTLPFVWHIWPFAGLDISEEDTASAMSIAAQRKASIYMVRYRHDFISGHSAFNRLRKRIEASKAALSFFDAREVSAHGHSTLVNDPKQPEVAREQVDAVVKALDARLRRPAAQPPGN